MTATADTAEATTEKPRFAIFRGKDAHAEDGIPMMRVEPVSDVVIEGSQKLIAAGANHGHDTRLLFATDRFSLAHAWFKSGFPLPRHSHDTDCLYYITGGSLKMGTADLGTGDGFFIPGGTPYTYTPGPNGVEVLEFRADGDFNIATLANNPAFWGKALETVIAKQDAWPGEARPSAID